MVKCNPDFILTISTPAEHVGVACPRCFVSAVRALHVFNQQCFDDGRNERKNMHVFKVWSGLKMHRLVQTLPRFNLHHSLCYITSTVEFYTESRLSGYIHFIVKLPQQHRQISTKRSASLPESAESSGKESMYGVMTTTICNIICNHSHYQSMSSGQKKK